VRRVLPGIDFRIQAKHPEEWDEYITSICKIYGFKRKENPTAFTKEGRYIGGFAETMEELERMFACKDVKLSHEDVVDIEVISL
jgi:hypothetical protein